MIQLTKENFQSEVLEAKGLVFVKFAAKAGCQPCIDFKPQYEEASNDPRMKFCAYERETLRGTPLDEIEVKYNIQTFPTVIAFEDGVLKGQIPKFKFLSERVLAGLILDEQKKLFNQQCYVEDLLAEVDMRRQAKPEQPISVTPVITSSTATPLPEITDPSEAVQCDSCQ